MRTFVITLRGSTDRLEQTKKSFGEGLQVFYGINGEEMGLRTVHPYEVDHPGSGYLISPKHVGLCLSHHMLWGALSLLPDDHFLILEDDAEFTPGWRDYLAADLPLLPPSWDLFYIGSCNCAGAEREFIGGGVYRVRWPMCTHAYMVRRKALPILLERHRRVFAPIDLSMMFQCLPGMEVFARLPRLVHQRNTDISP
jgi:GR25 family glycosyltransferase involved in LPS biosynthesis